jgi:streptogramin lyase
MSLKTGGGDYLYEIVDEWGEMPNRWTYDVAGVAVDSKGNVYMFNRGETPVVVLDSRGKYIDSWGDRQMFPFAHGITIGPDDSVWLTDTLDHTVRKCTTDGKVLMTIGVSGKSAKAMSGAPFNWCTHVALDPHTGDIFVSDGYLNSKVHKYAPDGRLLFSWGQPGNDPGQFNLPHNIATDRDGYVYVADRHNNRVQVFTPSGKLEHIWTGMAMPCGMCIDTRSSDQLCYIGELSSVWWTQAAPEFWEAWNRPGMGPRVSIYSLDGRMQARLCDNGQGEGLGQLIAPHGIAVTPEGDILVAEVSWSILGKKLKPSRPVRNFRRLVKVKKSPDQSPV